MKLSLPEMHLKIKMTAALHIYSNMTFVMKEIDTKINLGSLS